MNDQAQQLTTALRQFLLAERDMRRKVLKQPRRDKAIAEVDEALRNLTRLSGMAGGEKVFLVEDVKIAGLRAQEFSEATIGTVSDRFGPDAVPYFRRFVEWYLGRLIAELERSAAPDPAPVQPGLFGGDHGDV